MKILQTEFMLRTSFLNVNIDYKYGNCLQTASAAILSHFVRMLNFDSNEKLVFKSLNRTDYTIFIQQTTKK